MASAEAVAAVVEAGGAHVPPLMRDLETRLAALAASHGAVLGRHAGSTIAAGGKRLRPLLVFVAAGPAGRDLALRSAVAVELIHSAGLVHDDVLDGAVLRRGHPTVVATAGRAMATAAGDLLFAQAFAELAGGGSAEAVRILSDASSALAEGEFLQREDAWNLATSRERYLRRCDLKTARLFEAACRLGSLAAGGLRAERCVRVLATGIVQGAEIWTPWLTMVLVLIAVSRVARGATPARRRRSRGRGRAATV